MALSGGLNPQKIEQRLRSFEDSTGNQIVVVVTDDLLGYEDWEYATELGQKWGVGQEDKDNGIVFLIKPSGGKGERKTFIAIGEGLEGVIPDALTGTIVNHDVKRTPKMTTLAAVNTSNAVINAACSARLRANLNLGSRSCQTVTTDTPEIPPITTGSARLTARTSRPRCRALNKNGILRSRLAVLSRTGGEE